MATSQTPMEDAIRQKVTQAFAPASLEIFNDSHLHSHHKAMAGSTSQETHFRVYVTSDTFEGKRQPARHREVYSLLKDEMAAEGGIHALQLRTKTPQEAAATTEAK
ncbi:BolA domain UV induced protein Uvi31 [Recurvomyces mirabilis]|uniref:BolA domain UV induced protein Uvi31 n=1 Tax=Recurvomyces mirabilis TaxID=574656 RepID=A0AAE0WP14_9PEZI|nr:BolA domain UV induced protein Uvi31 [Recurvomyces mirabilis]